MPLSGSIRELERDALPCHMPAKNGKKKGGKGFLPLPPGDWYAWFKKQFV